MQDEKCEDKGGCEDCECNCGGSMNKDFKLAMIEKKEKIMQAKLEFLGKIKALIKKIPESKK